MGSPDPFCTWACMYVRVRMCVCVCVCVGMCEVCVCICVVASREQRGTYEGEEGGEGTLVGCLRCRSGRAHVTPSCSSFARCKTL